MKNPPPSRTADQFVVRLPEGMRDRVAAAAKANGRSMNAEIVAILAAGLDGATPDLSAVPAGTLLDAVIRLYGGKVEVTVTPEVAAEVGSKPKRARADAP
jgi:plasmid stability protein